MKILILGGTGILSTDFTRKTLDEGNDVWVVNRGNRGIFLDARANHITADLRNDEPDQIKKKLSALSFDVIVDFLSYKQDQLKTTLSIIDGLYSHYIFISSATAYKKKNDEIIREDTTCMGNSEWNYAYEKYKCELYLKEQDINYTIIRPYVTYGESRLPFQIIPDGYHYTLLERIKNNKPVVLLNNGDAICTLTSTVDFANVLYKLLMNPKAYKQDYHITSPFRRTWRQVYELYCKLMGQKPYLISVTEDDIRKFMPEAYQSLKGDKGTDWRFDNTKVLDAIGEYEFSIDPDTGIRRSVEFFEKNQRMQGIDYKWDGKIDYMIKHISGIDCYNCMKSDNSASSRKIYYYIMTNPITHNLYMIMWKRKHRDRG